VSSATRRAELIDFVEAPGRFMPAAPGRLLRMSARLALSADVGHTYMAVEGIRLAPDEVEDAIAEVAVFLVDSGTRRASWWLCERSMPVDLEQRLLDAGLARYDEDYLHAGMLLTKPPPAAEVEARQIATVDEFKEARRLQIGAFANPNIPQPTDEELADEFTRIVDPVFAAWVDGRIASVGRATFTPVGAYLTGGATAEWARGRGAYRAVVRARWDEAVERGTPALGVGAGPMSRPILERIGFEQVLQYRRLEQARDEAG
jgi:hypothetical protein